MDRLKREANPPVGQLASPIPQYKKPGSTDYEAVEGQHGAPFAILKDASGNIVSPATEDKLEQVRQLLTGVATEAKLEQVKSELELVKSELQTIKTNQTSGDQKVQLSGTIPVIVKEHVNQEVRLRYWGVNSGPWSSVVPVDMGKYTRRQICIRNNTDKAFGVEVGFTERTTSGNGGGVLTISDTVDCPAGAVTLISALNMPEMEKVMSAGMWILVRPNGTHEGTFDVSFWGGL